MSILISAVIPTYNRAQCLEKALQSLCRQTLVKSQYEIIVVDNNSSDNTQGIVEKFFSYGNVRYQVEKQQGVSCARNRGWKIASGQYIAFMDDDITANKNWLEKIIEAFRVFGSEALVVGGKVELVWESSRPAWLSEKVTFCLGSKDLGSSPVALGENQFLLSCNMAFSRGALKITGGFHPYICRTGYKLLSWEDTLIQIELVRKGYQRFYQPEAVVHHHILGSRLNKLWFIRRMYWEGVSAALVKIFIENGIKKRRRLYLASLEIKRLLQWPKRLAYLVMLSDDPEIFSINCFTWKKIGYILAMLGASK
jgi:glucosyl-dolichyl phosphate glucuronosyltransferase